MSGHQRGRTGAPKAVPPTEDSPPTARRPDKKFLAKAASDRSSTPTRQLRTPGRPEATDGEENEKHTPRGPTINWYDSPGGDGMRRTMSDLTPNVISSANESGGSGSSFSTDPENTHQIRHRRSRLRSRDAAIEEEEEDEGEDSMQRTLSSRRVRRSVFSSARALRLSQSTGDGTSDAFSRTFSSNDVQDSEEIARLESISSNTTADEELRTPARKRAFSETTSSTPPGQVKRADPPPKTRKLAEVNDRFGSGLEGSPGSPGLPLTPTFSRNSERRPIHLPTKTPVTNKDIRVAAAAFVPSTSIATPRSRPAERRPPRPDPIPKTGEANGKKAVEEKKEVETKGGSGAETATQSKKRALYGTQADFDSDDSFYDD